MTSSMEADDNVGISVSICPIRLHWARAIEGSRWWSGKIGLVLQRHFCDAIGTMLHTIRFPFAGSFGDVDLVDDEFCPYLATQAEQDAFWDGAGSKLTAPSTPLHRLVLEHGTPEDEIALMSLAEGSKVETSIISLSGPSDGGVSHPV